jgi:Protein of unknown function (DUF2794)
MADASSSVRMPVSGGWTAPQKSGRLHNSGRRRWVAMSRKSATVLALSDYRTKHRTLYFTRHELNQLLSLYSRQVARGVWRDYAIDHRDGRALFSVFRHTHEAPAYSIVKAAAAQARSPEFFIQSGRQRLRVSHSLSEALEYFQTRLSLVIAEG